MATSTTDKELMGYFSRLDEPQKKSLLELMKTFLKPTDFLSGVTIQQYNQELDEAIKRVERGEYTTLEELEKEMQSW
ncbi:MAG TPA: hypothetical protein VK618_05940 [Flavitalea sp.]|nr:hypothetical protein [Flavitalea sp.]